VHSIVSLAVVLALPVHAAAQGPQTPDAHQARNLAIILEGVRPSELLRVELIEGRVLEGPFHRLENDRLVFQDVKTTTVEVTSVATVWQRRTRVWTGVFLGAVLVATVASVYLAAEYHPAYVAVAVPFGGLIGGMLGGVIGGHVSRWDQVYP